MLKTREHFLSDWFYRKTRREQYTLLIGLSLIFVWLIFKCWLIPLHQQVDVVRKQVERVSQTLDHVDRLSGDIRQARQKTSVANKPRSLNLAELVDRSLRKFKLSMRGYQPGNDNEATVRLDSVSYKRLLGWLYELEQRQRVQITQFSLSRTNNPEQVNASVSLFFGQGKVSPQ